jgi:hypothetical protein
MAKSELYINIKLKKWAYPIIFVCLLFEVKFVRIWMFKIEGPFCRKNPEEVQSNGK